MCNGNVFDCGCVEQEGIERLQVPGDGCTRREQTPHQVNLANPTY